MDLVEGEVWEMQALLVLLSLFQVSVPPPFSAPRQEDWQIGALAGAEVGGHD